MGRLAGLGLEVLEQGSEVSCRPVALLGSLSSLSQRIVFPHCSRADVQNREACKLFRLVRAPGSHRDQPGLHLATLQQREQAAAMFGDVQLYSTSVVSPEHVLECFPMAIAE